MIRVDVDISNMVKIKPIVYKFVGLMNPTVDDIVDAVDGDYTIVCPYHDSMPTYYPHHISSELRDHVMLPEIFTITANGPYTLLDHMNEGMDGLKRYADTIGMKYE